MRQGPLEIPWIKGVEAWLSYTGKPAGFNAINAEKKRNGGQPKAAKRRRRAENKTLGSRIAAPAVAGRTGIEANSTHFSLGCQGATTCDYLRLPATTCIFLGNEPWFIMLFVAFMHLAMGRVWPAKIGAFGDTK
jgi:hypothetical protein